MSRARETEIKSRDIAKTRANRIETALETPADRRKLIYK